MALMVEVAVLDLCGGKLPTEEGDKWVLGTGCSKTALSQNKGNLHQWGPDKKSF
jgi:hypothetical protein